MHDVDVRSLFIDTSTLALEMVERPEFAARWERPSVLPEFSVRGLTGHLYRATGSVEAYLAREEPLGDPIDPATYYMSVVGEPDISSDLHRAVRARGEEAAENGHEALVRDWHALLTTMRERMRSEPTERRLRVFKDMVLTLDDYLATRLVELVVHIDDLALSAGLEAPRLPRPAFDVAIGTLVDVARLKHGELAVIRALARRERDAVQALRVL